MSLSEVVRKAVNENWDVFKSIPQGRQEKIARAIVRAYPQRKFEMAQVMNTVKNVVKRKSIPFKNVEPHHFTFGTIEIECGTLKTQEDN